MAQRYVIWFDRDRFGDGRDDEALPVADLYSLLAEATDTRKWDSTVGLAGGAAGVALIPFPDYDCWISAGFDSTLNHALRWDGEALFVADGEKSTLLEQGQTLGTDHHDTGSIQVMVVSEQEFRSGAQWQGDSLLSQAPGTNPGVTRVDRGKPALLIGLGTSLISAHELTPEEKERWLADPKSRRPQEVVAPGGALTVRGWSFPDPGIQPASWIGGGTGATSVLVGRNGAGKSLAIRQMREPLESLMGSRRVPVAQRPNLAELPTLVFDAGDQSSQPRLFSALLALLGWSEASELKRWRRRHAMAALGVYDDGVGPNAAASIYDLAAQPPTTLADALARSLARGLDDPDECLPFLVEALSQPMIGIDSCGRVSLCADTSPGAWSPEARRAAEAYVRNRARFQHERDLFQIARGLVEGTDMPPQPILRIDRHSAETYGRLPDPWAKAADTLDVLLRGLAPLPVTFAPGELSFFTSLTPTEAVVREVVNNLVRLPKEEDPATWESRHHEFADYPAQAARVCALLSEQANEIAPAFLKDAGRLRVSIAEAGEWHERRLIEELLPGRRPVDELPAGMRTWARICIATAAARLAQWPAEWLVETVADELSPSFRVRWDGTTTQAERSDGVDDSQDSMRIGAPHYTRAFGDGDSASITREPPPVERLIFFFDEPEVHLHPAAQDDALATVRQLADWSHGCVVASHSTSFLDEECTLLTRARDRTLYRPGIRLSQVAAERDAFGMRASDLVHACRGILLVEGFYDKRVIEKYSGFDLDRERIYILPLKGHRSVETTAEATLLYSLGIPVFVMLDNVRIAELKAITGPEGPGGTGQKWTNEERSLKNLHDALVHKELGAWAVPFDGQDIVTAIPDLDVHDALGSLGAKADKPFEGWDAFGKVARVKYRTKELKFKDYFASRFGVTVENVIEAAVNSDARRPSPVLHGLISRVLEQRLPPAQPGLHDIPDGPG